MKFGTACASVIFFLLTLVEASDSPKQKLIREFIGNGSSLKKEDRFIPPQSAKVTVSMVIYSILGIDSREVMELYGWLKVRWKDSRLTWRPQEWSNITAIFLPREYMWLPDIGIWNAIDSDKIDMMQSKGLTRLEVGNDGSVYAYVHFHSHSPCSVNGLLYPFDEEACEISLGTMTSTKDEFALDFGNLSTFDAETRSVGEWTLIGYRENTTVASDVIGGHQFSHCKIRIYLARKPLYHMLSVILPFSLLSMTAAAIFFLENYSDRFNIAVAVLLSMTLYIVIASQNIPKSMQKIPIMGIFLLNQMSLVIIMVFVSVVYPLIKRVVCKLCRRRPHMNHAEWERMKHISSPYVFLFFYIILTMTNGVIFLYIIPNSLYHAEFWIF